MELFCYSSKIDQRFWSDNNINIDSESVIADGVKIGRNVSITNSRICEGVVIDGNSRISNSVVDANVRIDNSCIDGAEIAEGVSVGPYARIRQGTSVGRGSRIGNFVEIKNASLGSDCKIAHLAYVGDAHIGDNCNIGCGVIFCNYDGECKRCTVVGDNVFIGSNVNLVAPVVIGDDAYIAAGSTITMDVGVAEFAIARARQENKKNFKNPYKNMKKQTNNR